ncbi:hypothetical protein MNBD_UNCLBAC01-1602 [hydrothermal vent metagenome]|uniref:Core domain-containing protein n=1 Tax=hydrothermal vent metagenome TaxID=652676 RepID=A0A3B1E3X4_9ZZZZ
MTKDNIKDVPVIHLTDTAIEKVNSMKAKEGKVAHYLRVGVITGGCAGLSYDMRFQKEPYENDTIIEKNGLKILINQESIPFIKGLEIDYQDTLKQSGFQYKNPNAQSSCGCGSSFS